MLGVVVTAEVQLTVAAEGGRPDDDGEDVSPAAASVAAIRMSEERLICCNFYAHRIPLLKGRTKGPDCSEPFAFST